MAKKHNRKFYKNSKTSTSTVTTVAENGDMVKFLYLFGTKSGETRRKAEISAYVPKDVEGYRSYLVKRGMRLLDDAKGADETVTQFQVYLVSDEAKTTVAPNIFYDPQQTFSSAEKTAFNAIKEEFEAAREKMHEEAAKKAAEKPEEKKPAVKAAASKTSAPTSAKDWKPAVKAAEEEKPAAKPTTISAEAKGLIGDIVKVLSTKTVEQLRAIKTMLG